MKLVYKKPKMNVATNEADTLADIISGLALSPKRKKELLAAMPEGYDLHTLVLYLFAELGFDILEVVA